MILEEKFNLVRELVHKTLAHDTEGVIEKIYFPSIFFSEDIEYCTITIITEKANDVNWLIKYEQQLNALNRPFLTKCMTQEDFNESNEAFTCNLAWEKK